MTALIVAPSAVTARMIEHLLFRAGCQAVHSFRTAPDAMAFLRSGNHSISLLVTEWDLPGQSGLEFLDELSAGGESPPPVILVGTRNAREDVIMALEARIEAYLLKPIDPEGFVARAAHILARRAPVEEETAPDELEEESRAA